MLQRMEDHNMEGARQVLVHEMMKTKPNASLVKKEMDVTFALHRKEFVKDKPVISQMLQRWPALFTESQVYHEFSRVVGENLRDFFDALDHISTNLMEIFKKKKGLTGQLLAELLRLTKTSETTDIRRLCLRGLPIILGDDSSAFFKTCSDAADKEAYNETPVGIIIIGEENSPLNPSRLGIVLEGNVVFDGPANLPQAFCVLFGLTYALHLDYLKYMKNTFLFVQQVMFNLGKSQLPPKIQTLKNQLAE
ncbi:uncharacterized protein LOC125296540 isoform X2 [Alosa alosa]|uniref:uncharacterized protein LOC125296540 isoform X2 n=1 Tax=Alosa alosa TaxID=278164 RepID=UPI0020153843|nr:uncharacterized protein LOC125296540 isoform X2 [Alosa alosa]